jgi:nitrogen-specific signal transduction histidine kinase
MAKKKNETHVPNPISQLAHEVHDHGLRGSAQRIIDMIYEMDSKLYSFAITEDNKAMVIVIAKDDYFDGI